MNTISRSWPVGQVDRRPASPARIEPGADPTGEAGALHARRVGQRAVAADELHDGRR
jgi:hypothetical protein